MSKQSKNPAESSSPAFLAELLEKGTITIRTKSVDELTETINAIPADVKYMSGAQGKHIETGEFTLRLDLISKK